MRKSVGTGVTSTLSPLPVQYHSEELTQFDNVVRVEASDNYLPLGD